MITIHIKEAEKCASEYSMFLTFPYDSTLVGIVRELTGRVWHTENKQWEVPVSRLKNFISKIDGYEAEIIVDDPTIFEEKKVEIPNGFSFKTKPFQHQIDGFNYGLTHDRWLLGDEQGLGKTKQVIDIACAKKEQMGYKHCLIICGVNGLKWNWQNEIGTHSNEQGWILGQKIRGTKVTIGSTKDKIKDLQNVDVLPYFLITNVESLRDDEVAKTIADLCKKDVINMIAFDECHKAKNPSSQQGKGILKVSAKTMIAMSGTPLMNTPLDLYMILKWLGYENHAFYSFKNHYCTMGGYGGYEVVGYKNLGELQDKLDEIMLRRLKGDVLDLPDKIFIDEYVDMTPKQSQIYKEVTKEIKSNIDNVKIAPNPLAQLIRLRQATGYTGILSSTIKESAKLDRMVDIVEEALANNKKVVIFSNWTDMTDAIDEKLATTFTSNGTSLASYTTIITGETPDADRQARVKAFQENKDIKIIVGTIGAMGTGLTLTAGTIEIFMDEPWNMALKDQAIDRCHRIGAKENVTIYTLLAKDTIDERIHKLVYKKGKMSEAIVDGKFNGDKEALVDYLIGD